VTCRYRADPDWNNGGKLPTALRSVSDAILNVAPDSGEPLQITVRCVRLMLQSTPPHSKQSGLPWWLLRQQICVWWFQTVLLTSPPALL